MTLASKITLIRVAFIPAYMVLMYLSGGQPGLWMWLSLAVFIIASLTDYVDGQIARKCNQVSDFGKFLDPLADKLLTIAAMTMFCMWGSFTAWALMLVLTREFAVTGLRLVAVGKGKVIAQRAGPVKDKIAEHGGGEKNQGLRRSVVMMLWRFWYLKIARFNSGLMKGLSLPKRAQGPPGTRWNSTKRQCTLAMPPLMPR